MILKVLFSLDICVRPFEAKIGTYVKVPSSILESRYIGTYQMKSFWQTGGKMVKIMEINFMPILRKVLELNVTIDHQI
jgi:hypothetical protein